MSGDFVREDLLVGDAAIQTLRREQRRVRIFLVWPRQLDVPFVFNTVDVGGATDRGPVAHDLARRMSVLLSQDRPASFV